MKMLRSSSDRAIPVAAGLDTPWLRVVIHVNDGMTALLTGDLETARRRLPRRTQTVPQVYSLRLVSLGLPIFGLASISALRGD